MPIFYDPHSAKMQEYFLFLPIKFLWEINFGAFRVSKIAVLTILEDHKLPKNVKDEYFYVS